MPEQLGQGERLPRDALAGRIFDESAHEVHLELGDNWLEEAARVAAQHEPDPEVRRQLLENPYKFLVDHKWNALANATTKELETREPAAHYDAEPDADDRIPASPRRRSAFRPWSRRRPKSGDKASAAALIDLVARERANQSHHEIEKILAAKILARGYKPEYNDHIDVFFSCQQGAVIVEVKSCTENNVHAQVRKGVSQLLEYRYLYAGELTEPVHFALAIEAQPGPTTSWLVGYLQSLGITVAWLDRPSDRLLTSGVVPSMLEGIFEAT